MGSQCLRTIYMPQTQTMPTCSLRPAWSASIDSTVQIIKWSLVWTREELYMFTTRDASPLVLNSFSSIAQLYWASIIYNGLKCSHYTKVKLQLSLTPVILLQCGVTPVSRISLEKLEVVQTSVCWATATRVGRVAVGLALAWAMMANHARVRNITANQILLLSINSPSFWLIVVLPS